jgi:predicted  nucleic acid-binding Zn-ribbon protein
MSVAAMSLEMADEYVSGPQQRVPALQNELSQIEARKRKIEEELSAANEAHVRLAKFRELLQSEPGRREQIICWGRLIL